MEVCLESSACAGSASPRISFSHDLSLADASDSTAASLPLDSSASSDFDFSRGAVDIFSHDSSPADDIFFDGKLLPLPIKHPPPSSSSSRPSAAPAAYPPPVPRKRGSLQEIMASDEDDDDNGAAGSRSSPQKPFWLFRRSTSLNWGGNARSSLCRFPLLRSKSSGSSSMKQIKSNTKQCNNISNNSNNNTAAIATTTTISKGNDTSSTPFTEWFRKSPNETTKPTKIYYYSGNSRRSYSCNAVRISPILNVPTPSSTGSILGYLLCKRGDKGTGRSSSAAVTSSP